MKEKKVLKMQFVNRVKNKKNQQQMACNDEERY